MPIYHTAKDRTPYVYLIGWSSHNKWYYGVRFSKGCHPSDLFESYFTSSKSVKNFISEYGLPDRISVRRTFNSVENARTWEETFLKRVRAAQREDFLNRANGRAICPDDARRGAKNRPSHQRQNDPRRELSRKRMKAMHKQHAIQYRDEQTRSTARQKAMATRKARQAAGVYTEAQKQGGIKGRATVLAQIRSGDRVNSGQFKCQPVLVGANIYYSLSEAARSHNISVKAAYNRCRKDTWPDWGYV